MNVRFTHHSKNRYRQRFSRVESQDFKGDRIDLARIRREIARRGRAYWDSATETYYIVVNNLKVYVAKAKGDSLAIVTTYPYEKSQRGKLNRLERVDLALS